LAPCTRGFPLNDNSRVRRAAQIFRFDEAHLASPIVERIWRTYSEPVESFMSVAETHWEMVVTTYQGRTSLTVRGPETRATMASIPQDAEFFGVQFRIGTFMRDVPVGLLVDEALTLPEAGRRSFWLNGSAWEFPTFDNVDVFVRRLLRREVVVRDEAIEAALSGEQTGLSARSVQRRIRRATGLTRAAIGQIERAHRAVALLESGEPILSVVDQVGYADQPHLTRALRRFVGHTPARILRERAD
jgi:AraC-like DNA-binding protein